MNQSTIKFVVQTLGADEAQREFAKIERAAAKAGTTVKKYLGTAAGESKLIGLQQKAAAAHAENAKSAKTAAEATNQAAGATDRASRSQAGYFGHIAKTTVQSALINKLFLEFVDVSGQAIQQVDLMNNFPATMRSMGESTQDAGEAMNALRNYVGQVGGNLGDATSYVTRFTGATKDVKAATAIFVGLNNALIAGDSSMEEQRQAAVQFAQALERGKPDLREWRTLTQNMSFQLDQVAKSMGYVNANELGEALSQGEESMAAFTTALTKMSTGTGPIAEQARARMSGMQFSFNVLKNTLVQGLAAIIQTIGRENIVSFFTFLTQVVQVLTKVVITLITALITLFNFFGRLFGLPAIKLKKDVEGVAAGIGSGAGNAEDLADGMKDAGDEAKKLNKSLASFDKMNVLPDKESGSGKDKKDTGGGGAGFDAGQLGELGDLFGDIGGGLEAAGKWAKIFAGVLVGIAGIKFAQGVIDQIAGISKSFKTAGDGIAAFKKSLVGGVDKEGKKVEGLAQKLGNLPTIITGKIDGIGPAFAKFGKFLTNPYVLIAAAIAAIVGGLIYLYNKNEDFKRGFDSVWGGVTKTFKDAGNALVAVFKPAIEGLQKAWSGFLKAIEPVTIKIGELFKIILPGVGGMELFGKAVAFVARILLDTILTPIKAFVAILAALAYALIWVTTKVLEFATAIINFFTANFGDAVKAVTDFVKNGIEFMGKKFNEIVQGMKDAWNGFLDFIRPAVDFFTKLFTDIKDAILSVWETITKPLVDQFEKLKKAWTDFTKIFDKRNSEVKKGFDDLTSGISDVWSKMTDKLNEAWGKFYDKIKPGLDKISELFNDLKKAVNGAVESIKKKFDELKQSIKPVMETVGKLYNEHIKPIIDGIKKWATENEVLKKALQALGIVIAVVVLAPLALVVIAVGLVVAAFVALAFAVLWVVTKFIEFATYILGGGLWEDIKTKAAEVGQWFKDKFNEALEFVKNIWSTIAQWFKENVWDKIVAVFATVGTWFKDRFQEAWDAITTIFGILGDFFKERWENVKANLSAISTWFKDRFQEAWNGITAVFGAVGTWFGDRWNDIKNVFNGVRQWFTDKFRDAWNGITSVFSGVSEWFRVNVIDKIVNTFGGIKDRITGFFTGVWDGVARGLRDALNSILKLPLTIPSVTVAGKTIGGQTLIPRLARGGIIKQSTLINAGENGDEAIVPLENNLEWLDKLASKINSSTGGGGQPVNLTIQIGEEKVASTIIDLINEKTQMSGRNTIYV